MSDTEQRFQSLADRFKVLTHNLSECQNPKQRRELLKGMMLVSTLETLLVCSPIRKADARSGVKPHILTKSTSAASRFRAVIGHSFPPPTPAMKTIRTVPTGRKASERRACLLPDSLT